MSPPKKPASLSHTTMTEYVLPTHANALGNVFGGQVMAWMDICAAICAQRHCGCIAVTAGIDDLSFEHPIKVGQVARIEARVTAAFTSSVEVSVQVTGEDAASGVTWPCVAAFMTFVALGPVGQKVAVPPLELTTPEEVALEADAQARRQERLKRRRGVAGGKGMG